MVHPLTFDERGNVVGQLPAFMTAQEILEFHYIVGGELEGDIVLATTVDEEERLWVISGEGKVLEANERDPHQLLPVSFE